MDPLEWFELKGIRTRSYRCGYCGTEVASEKGWQAHRVKVSTYEAFVYVCHKCTRPSFFDYDNGQTPGPLVGGRVEHVTDSTVADLYEEARKCAGASSPTATVLCCRKLLMHIAVAKGADPGKNFVEYVSYLADNHYFPPDARSWVDQIRAKGNEANHQIIISTAAEAEELLAFLEMLLKIIYEFPTKAAIRAAAPQKS